MYRRPTLRTHTQLVVFGLGEDGVDGQLQPLGEVLEPGVGRGLQDYCVPRQEDAPGFVLVPVVPALAFRQLDRGAAAGGEGDLVDLAGSLDGEAASSECLLDCGDVLVHLGDGAEVAAGADRFPQAGGDLRGNRSYWNPVLPVYGNTSGPRPHPQQSSPTIHRAPAVHFTKTRD